MQVSISFPKNKIVWVEMGREEDNLHTYKETGGVEKNEKEQQRLERPKDKKVNQTLCREPRRA